MQLSSGSHPVQTRTKSIELAQKNLEVRQTPRAYKLLNLAAIKTKIGNKF